MASGNDVPHDINSYHGTHHHSCYLVGTAETTTEEEMKESIKKGLVVGALAVGALAAAAFAEPAVNNTIKTRLAHFSGTNFVLVISYLPDEITSITCDSWTMMGVGSWKDQNNFTIPGSPVAAVAVINAHGFNGYCKEPGSIIAHTDSGDVPGALDAGPGNWTASTKLTFSKPKS